MREAATGCWDEALFVQLMGGAVLHQGRVAEMKTGEGKTLVATLAAYLNALKAVHIVTSTTTSQSATPNGWANI